MIGVADVANDLDVTGQTIRIWTREFEPYFSAGAAPPKGQTRTFTTEDLEVLALIAEMRNQRRGYDEIHEALKAGQRAQLTSPTPKLSSEEIPYALVDRLTRELTAQHQARIEQLEGERDYLRKLLEAERRKVEALTERAVSAETALKIFKEQQGHG